MARKLVEHILSILLVSAVFIALILFYQEDAQRQLALAASDLEHYLQLNFIDFGNPLDKALFKETLDVFHPDRVASNDSLLQAINDYRREQFTSALYKTGADERGLTKNKIRFLTVMYLQFIVIYLVVMSLCYYGAQTIGIVRFVKMKQGTSSYLIQCVNVVTRGNLARSPGKAVVLLAKALLKGAAYLILFAPAYVIAYSFKTKFDTDSYFFMIVLGVLSNGLLINYANKFFTLLVTESRKGYVETAVVKNLHASYSWDAPGGIPMKSVLRLRKHFPSHVFQHIFLNARYQFVQTTKEFASFLITGLVIIEMALNIQGHLSYEMLKNILSKHYAVVAAIILAIFLLVKATEIAVDLRVERLNRKYENRVV